MKPIEAKKELLKIENDLVRDTQLFCANNNIEWTNQHSILLRNNLRSYFEEGVYPVIKEMFGFDKIDLNAED